MDTPRRGVHTNRQMFVVVTDDGTVDSLIDLGFVSVTFWSAVEAHGVHRDMGHLFGRNLHLEHTTGTQCDRNRRKEGTS